MNNFHFTSVNTNQEYRSTNIECLPRKMTFNEDQIV